MSAKATILGNIKEEHTEKFQRELFDDGTISDQEKFDILDAAGVEEILWSKSLNKEYSEWMYFNLN